MKDRTLTLVDGTVVREGGKVRARGENGYLRVATVLTIFKGVGIDKAILTAGNGFGTVIRSRYQIKSCRRERETP